MGKSIWSKGSSTGAHLRLVMSTSKVSKSAWDAQNKRQTVFLEDFL